MNDTYVGSSRLYQNVTDQVSTFAACIDLSVMTMYARRYIAVDFYAP